MPPMLTTSVEEGGMARRKPEPFMMMVDRVVVGTVAVAVEMAWGEKTVWGVRTSVSVEKTREGEEEEVKVDVVEASKESVSSWSVSRPSPVTAVEEDPLGGGGEMGGGEGRLGGSVMRMVAGVIPPDTKRLVSTGVAGVGTPPPAAPAVVVVVVKDEDEEEEEEERVVAMAAASKTPLASSSALSISSMPAKAVSSALDLAPPPPP